MSTENPNAAQRVTASDSSSLSDGRTVQTFVLRNAKGASVRISELGGTLLSWIAPDRHGNPGEILLGHDTLDDYLSSRAYLGALVGRWANRIESARFRLDGVDYQLPPNEGDNLLHGGQAGFHQRLWHARPAGDSLLMRLDSPDGEGGFPGQLQVEVRYRLSDDGTLEIDYLAQADRLTPVNLTNHAYFNLTGQPDRDVRDHRLTIHADSYFAVDGALIPQQREPVERSPFDFRRAAPIGPALDVEHAQIRLAGGFDHCYVLHAAGPSAGTPAVREVARLEEPESGRVLTVSTDQPGLQFYSGNFLEGVAARGGKAYRRHAGLCLETGGFPNQINMADRDAVLVMPGRPYRQLTRYQVSAG
ncbi:Aldose 1-epimerase [Burkholderia glumae]|uniref:aldose epimerase family protein n=1 Tax=Burkholderia glumae TaxID=337 RepID=UPI001374005B|nr:aldose epimerase family protein [Burkholderia glumae]MCR1770046.1 galactose mutarotase [Burkholderia glumae]QHP93855.1 galactose mutarotase [Burkholderia glumae]QKM51568.1 Aldose 1-epimerase [Burkholderia glumae]